MRIPASLLHFCTAIPAVLLIVLALHTLRSTNGIIFACGGGRSMLRCSEVSDWPSGIGAGARFHDTAGGVLPPPPSQEEMPLPLQAIAAVEQSSVQNLRKAKAGGSQAAPTPAQGPTTGLSTGFTTTAPTTGVPTSTTTNVSTANLTLASNYHPSSFEEEWSKVKRKGKLCATAMEQATRAQLWINYSLSVFTPARQPAREPTDEEAAVLSYFEVGEGAEKSKAYIEPLSGVARHPLALHGGGVKCNEQVKVTMDWSPKYSGDLFSTKYLVINNFCGRAGPKPRVAFFDLGCTRYANDPRTPPTSYVNYASGSGAGPSIPLFYSMFKDRCIVFDDIYAWEGAQYNAKDWWKPVPVEMRHKIRFYNTLVEERSIADSVAGKKAGDASFLRMLPLAVSPEDYVVVKVDIDGGPELEIVEAIAARPELSSLVDELFFEYHFYYDGLNFGWGPSVVKGSSVDAAIELMSRLRHAGIRAHFWI